MIWLSFGGYILDRPLSLHTNQRWEIFAEKTTLYLCVWFYTHEEAEFNSLFGEGLELLIQMLFCCFPQQICSMATMCLQMCSYLFLVTLLFCLQLDLLELLMVSWDHTVLFWPFQKIRSKNFFLHVSILLSVIVSLTVVSLDKRAWYLVLKYPLLTKWFELCSSLLWSRVRLQWQLGHLRHLYGSAHV